MSTRSLKSASQSPILADFAGTVSNGGYGGVFQQAPMGLQPLQSTSQGLQDFLATPAPEMGQGLDQFGSDAMWVDFFPGVHRLWGQTCQHTEMLVLPVVCISFSEDDWLQCLACMKCNLDFAVRCVALKPNGFWLLA